METFYEATPQLFKESAIALGFFDGVHPGHQAVIRSAIEAARRLGVVAGVVTFSDHPRALITGQAPLLLTDITERLELFAALGVDATLVLTFSEALCKLTPGEYVETILLGSMGARSISVGHNHHFGRDREGDANLLRTMGGKHNFEVHVANMVNVDLQEVSSTRIREMITAGEVESASRLLSRPFAVAGEVVRGDGRGRSIGFATANLDIWEYHQLPARGVYAVCVNMPDGRRLNGVVNVGFRPTFTDPNTPKICVEAHILDFDEDIYGQRLKVEFLKYIRAEQKFAGVDALKAQIKDDTRSAREYLESLTARSDENPNPKNVGASEGDKLPA